LFGDHEKRLKNKFLQKQAKFQYSIYEYVTGVRCHCQKKTPGTWLTPLDQDISWYIYIFLLHTKKVKKIKSAITKMCPAAAGIPKNATKKNRTKKSQALDTKSRI